jgi:hypothetical protein
MLMRVWCIPLNKRFDDYFTFSITICNSSESRVVLSCKKDEIGNMRLD